MATQDIQSRPYARLSQLKPGDEVIVDDGFNCMARWSTRRVESDPDKSDNDADRLWIPCKSGRHYLAGQLGDDDDTDALIGIYPYSDDFKRGSK